MYPPVSTGVDPGIDLLPKVKGYITIICNNIIVNTQKSTKDPSGTGYGVLNYYSETSFFMLENNCLYNNVGRNYKNMNSIIDIYVDPLFVNQRNHDYHLKSNFPCIDAGYTSSDYSTELGENSNQINIGRYG